MGWVSVDKDGAEWVFDEQPCRYSYFWNVNSAFDNMVQLPSGTIEKIIGRVLTWDDEPVEI